MHFLVPRDNKNRVKYWKCFIEWLHLEIKQNTYCFGRAQRHGRILCTRRRAVKAGGSISLHCPTTWTTVQSANITGSELAPHCYAWLHMLQPVALDAIHMRSIWSLNSLRSSLRIVLAGHLGASDAFVLEPLDHGPVDFLSER